jgi:nucleolin
VRAVFEAAGTITVFDMPVFEDSGRNRGKATITYSSAGEAAAAIALSGSELQGRWLKVEPFVAFAPRDAGREPSAPAPTVFVGNLPYDVTEEQMREVFGVRARVRGGVRARRVTGVARCYGYARATGVRRDQHGSVWDGPRDGARGRGRVGGAGVRFITSPPLPAGRLQGLRPRGVCVG